MRCNALDARLGRFEVVEAGNKVQPEIEFVCPCRGLWGRRSFGGLQQCGERVDQTFLSTAVFTQFGLANGFCECELRCNSQSSI